MTQVTRRPLSVAFFLPQFHPTDENNRWWGPGFTEWSNVVRGAPRFRGHNQPHIPADLGFYDLRLHETRVAQANLARTYGIDAFCYYHYWFNGRRVLSRPIDDLLASREPDLPFLLCWANENWTRVWDGGDRQVLLAQTYGPEDDLRHARWLAGAFADPRYLRLGGRPVFLVYRAADLPDSRRTTDVWRTELVRLGVGEPFLVRVESNFREERQDPPATLGFDAAVEFQPNLYLDDERRKTGRIRSAMSSRTKQLQAKLGRRSALDSVHSYSEVVEHASLPRPVPYLRFPCVTPGWDNTPRRPRTPAFIIRDSTPEQYERWVFDALMRENHDGGSSTQLLFVNAWNEWGEGCHLEPCERWGHAYLEAHHKAVTRAAQALQNG